MEKRHDIAKPSDFAQLSIGPSPTGRLGSSGTGASPAGASDSRATGPNPPGSRSERAGPREPHPRLGERGADVHMTDGWGAGHRITFPGVRSGGRARMFLHRRRAAPGQVAVETAITVPMMIFFVLGTIQLGMIHQAQLMTEYAAYRAARSAVVNNGDCDRMAYAALVALTPTLPNPSEFGMPINGRADTLFNAAKLFNFWRLGTWLTNMLGFKMVDVQILNPAKSKLNNTFNSLDWRAGKNEIDFDDLRPAAVAANNLSIRVKYFYEMRIPFANRMIHSWLMGTELLKNNMGLLFETQELGVKVGPFGYSTGVNSYGILELRGLAKGGDYTTMWVAANLPNAGIIHPIFLAPLKATYTMRMQSNLMKSKISQCAVN
jgi:TadE-like protein